MTVSQTLEKYLKEKGYTKADVAKISGVPYTTIDGLFKKGDENIKLTTLKKLAVFMGMTLDELAGIEVKAKQEYLSVETRQENQLLKKYRMLSAVDKEDIDVMVKTKYERLQKSSEKDARRLG